MKNIRDSIKLFRFNMINIILFEIILKTVSFAVLVPLYYAVISLTVNLSGISYLTKETAKKFFKAPSTYAFLLIMLLFAAMYIMVNVSGICYSYHRANYLKKTGPLRMFAVGLRNSFRMLRPKNLPMCLFVLAYLPVIGNIILSFNLLNIKAPYVIDIVSVNTYVTITVLAVYLFFVIYNFRYTFMIHIFCVEKISFPKSMDRTRELTRGRKLKSVGGVVSWCVLLIMIPALANYFYTGPLLQHLIKSTAAIKIAGMIYEAVKMVLSIIYVLLGLPIIYSYICNHYYNMIPEKEGSQNIDNYDLYDAKKSGKNERRAFLILLTVALLLNLGFYVLKRYNVITLNAQYLDKVTITAHRGDSSGAPENTLAAFELAIEKGADVIELDVRQTKDGEIVVMHDENLKRVCGVNKKVGELTFEELRKYSPGKKFKGKNKELYKDEKIPTLRETLDLVDRRVKLNIELKPARTDEGFEKKVVEILDEYDYYDNCVVTSQTYGSIKKVKRRQPQITTIYVMSVAMGDFYDLEYADGFSIKYRFINNEVIRQAHKAGKEVYAWTVDDKNILESMMLLDVDSVITNDPDGIRRAMYETYYGDTLIERLNTYIENQL